MSKFKKPVVVIILLFVCSAAWAEMFYEPIMTAEKKSEGYDIVEMRVPGRYDNVVRKAFTVRSGDLGLLCYVKGIESENIAGPFGGQPVIIVRIELSNDSETEGLVPPAYPIVRLTDGDGKVYEPIRPKEFSARLKNDLEGALPDTSRGGHTNLKESAKDDLIKRQMRFANAMARNEYRPKEIAPGSMMAGSCYYSVVNPSKIDFKVMVDDKSFGFIFIEKRGPTVKAMRCQRCGTKITERGGKCPKCGMAN